MSFESFLTYDAPTPVKKKKKQSSSSSSHSRPSHSSSSHQTRTPPPVPSSSSSSSKVSKANGAQSTKRPHSGSSSGAAPQEKRKRVRTVAGSGFGSGCSFTVLGGCPQRCCFQMVEGSSESARLNPNYPDLIFLADLRTLQARWRPQVRSEVTLQPDVAENVSKRELNLTSNCSPVATHGIAAKYPPCRHYERDVCKTVDRNHLELRNSSLKISDVIIMV